MGLIRYITYSLLAIFLVLIAIILMMTGAYTGNIYAYAILFFIAIVLIIAATYFFRHRD